MNLTHDQLETLRHMLGINTPLNRAPLPYRDYYCASPGDAHLWEMQRIGVVRLYRVSDGYEWFCCTEAGRVEAMASHKTIRKSRGARRYAKFLDMRDCWPDLTFKRFLTAPELRPVRQGA